MANANNRQLTLTTVGANVTVRVTYQAVFNQLERHMASNGLIFRERIAVIGVDPAGATTGTVLHNFPVANLAVPAGVEPLNRDRQIIVTRASLQEDVGLGDNDEIRCRIRIEPIGMPALVEGFTDQEILLG